MKASKTIARKSLGAFTLAEVSVAMGIGMVVIASMLTIFISFLRSYNSTTLMRNTSSRASLALERMVYGVGPNAGLREASTNSVTVTYPSGGWKIAYTNLFFQYAVSTSNITDQACKTICTNIISSSLSNYVKGCRIWVTVSESAGGRTYTNAMTSFVQFRN